MLSLCIFATKTNNLLVGSQPPHIHVDLKSKASLLDSRASCGTTEPALPGWKTLHGVQKVCGCGTCGHGLIMGLAVLG